MLRSWKTTVAGALIALATVVNMASSGEVVNKHNLVQLLIGVGLIAAKDHNVSGGGGGV